MAISTEAVMDAATRLHDDLLARSWNGSALEGPDSGVRFNARVGRFIKSYFGFLSWHDSYVYMQAQAYWALANWLLSELTGSEQAAELAELSSHYILDAQQLAGYWEYPNPEWRGRIATIEGDMAALALLESFDRTRHAEFLDGAKRWYDYVIDCIGFQGGPDAQAVNYFARSGGVLVPNNSTLTLLVFAKLAHASGDERYMERCAGMVNWLKRSQLYNGELPYALAGSTGEDRNHFLCYQYNAFEFLDLAEYYRLTRDQTVLDILRRLAPFLAGGLTAEGAAKHDCVQPLPEVVYYTAAIARSLSEATAMGLGDYRRESDRAYWRVLSQINLDGSLKFHSRGDYGFLTDRRTYPRNLAMILYHLLWEVKARGALTMDGRVVRELQGT